jgi:hypothetical protein
LLSIIFSPELNVVSFGTAFVSFFAGAGFEAAAFGASALDVSAGLGGSGGGGGSTGGGAGVTGSAAAGAGSDFNGSVLSLLEEQLDTTRRKPATNRSGDVFFI